jgi:exopolysaccharide biosynthesis polyprenyl glycosylphosphotransferase
MAVRTSVSAAPRPAVIALPNGVQLPTVDVRSGLDERAFRGWSESTRRLSRVATLFASDSLAGLLAIGTVLYTWEFVSAGGVRPVPDPVPLIAMVFCLLPLSLWACGAYKGGTARVDLVKVASGVVIAAFLGWVQARLFGRDTPDLPNKTAYLYSAAVVAWQVWLFRLALDKVVTAAYDSGLLRRKVIVVGTAEEAERLDERCRNTSGCELEIVGRVASRAEEAGTSAGKVPLVGEINRIGPALSNAGAQGVIIAANLPFHRLEGVVGHCFRLGATVSVLPGTLKALSGTQFEVRQSAIGSFLRLRPIKLGVPQLAVKRSMDLILTVVGLLLTWPVFVLIAIAIKLDSRGPVFFKQVRAGVGGRPFEIVKFRTMRVGADQEKESLQHLNEYPDARLFKMKVDPRVTRLGAFLRRTSLDELPQVFNVLKGEMSLVGPRPCVPEELKHYCARDLTRLFVVPGVTGPWQVSGRNQILDFDHVVRLERDYIQSWSIVKDLVILALTVPALFRRGAY